MEVTPPEPGRIFCGAVVDLRTTAIEFHGPQPDPEYEFKVCEA